MANKLQLMPGLAGHDICMVTGGGGGGTSGGVITF